MKLEINFKKRTKNSQVCVDQHAIEQLTDQWKIKNEIKKMSWDENGKTTYQKKSGMQQKQFLRGKFRGNMTSQETWRVSNKQLNLYVKELENMNKQDLKLIEKVNYKE